MSKSLFFLIVLIVFSIIFSQLFFYQLDGYQAATLIERLTSANSLFVESLLATALIVLLVNGRLPHRLAAYIIFSLLITVYCLQYASLYLTGDYVSPTALDNIQHIGLILSPAKMAIIGTLCLSLLATILVAEFTFNKTTWKKAVFLFAACLISAALIKTGDYQLSTDTLSARAELNQSDDKFAGATSPIRALFNSFERTRQSGLKSRPMAKAELKQVGKFGIFYDESKAYPLIKDYIYQTEVPFPPKRSQANPGTPLNIIVFFSEGLSARIIQPYNNQYPGLTPNIADFSSSAMKVDNYYNHTFATYRGLLGQLCSIFPMYAGGRTIPKTDYYCLGDLFNEEGYETHFLFSQQKKNTDLDELIAKTNIDHILAQNDLRHLYLADEPEKRPLALSDQQFFKATIEHLRSLENLQKSGDETPFFMGLYNIGTHAYYHMSDDGVSYKNKEQDSYILNAIHNYDNAFGKFWRYFQQSDLFENTIVIFTADHAHYQGKDFTSLVKEQSDYQPYFVDEIPLLIYHPAMELPTGFDAKFTSSLDLAPTVAQLMQFENRSNSFLGQSVFERVTNEGLAYGDGYLYLTGPGGIREQNEYYDDPSNDTNINQMYKLINNIQALERDGRIWNRGLKE